MRSIKTFLLSLLIFAASALQADAQLIGNAVSPSVASNVGIFSAEVEEPTLFTEYWDSGITVYSNSTTSFDHTTLKPSGTERWVDLVNGDNSNDGSSRAQAYADIPTAEADNPAVINLVSGVYHDGNGVFSGFDGYNPTVDTALVAADGAGTVIIFRGRLGDYFTWTQQSSPNDNVYSTTRNNVTNIVDRTHTRSGEYLTDGTTEVPIPYDKESSIANVQANAGSWYETGGTLYIHTHDSREPDEDVYVMLAVDNVDVTNDITLYAEGIEFWGRRPVKLSYSGTNDGTFVGYKSAFRYADTTAGLDIRDAAYSYCVECSSTDNNSDGFGYSIDNSHNTVLKFFEERTFAARNGWDAQDNNDNGSTAHDEAVGIRVGSEYTANYGPNMVDVLGAKSWNYDIYAHNSNGTSSGDSNFQTGTYNDNSPSIVWIQNSRSAGSTYDRYRTSGGHIVSLGSFSGDATDFGTIYGASDDLDLNILVLGQSVADYMFNDVNLTDPTIGIDTLKETLFEYYGKLTVIDGAKAGISINADNAGAAGSYLNSSDAKSTDYTAQITTNVTAAGLVNSEIDFIPIVIGNTDAAGIDAGSSTKAEVKTSYNAFLGILESDFSNAKIGISPVGADTNSTEFTGYREYGQIESELLADNEAYFIPSYVNKSYRDDTHLDDDGAGDYWADVGERIAALEGKRSTGGTVGASVSSMTFDIDSNQIYVNYTLDDGNAISQADAASLETDMFTFDVDGTLYNASYAVLEKSNDRIRARTNGYTLVGNEVITLNAMNTTFRNATLSNILADANDLPLQKNTAIQQTVTTVAPSNSVLPVITGTERQGETLTCSTGTWSGTPTPTYAYGWERSGVDISGETSSTYLLAVADVGETITCVVTATNIAGAVEAESAATGIIEQEYVAPVNTVLPVISGTEQQGETLSVTDGTWTGYPAPSITYQWQRGGVNISGATSNTYLLAAADVGETITCEVTGTNAEGSATAETAATGTIDPENSAPVNSVLPVISGTEQVGETLSCSTGTWSGFPTPTYTYQWENTGVDISGATSSTYLVDATDEGDTLTCDVTATNSEGAATAESAATGTIAAASAGATGLAGLSEFSGDSVVEWWVHLTDSVANDTTQTIAEYSGDTNLDFWNGNDSGSSDDVTISGSGTSSGYIEATDAGDYLVSKNDAATATIWNRLVRSDQDVTYIIALRTPSSIGTAFYVNVDSAASGDPDFRILSVSGNMEVRVADGAGTFKNTNMGALSASTDYLIAIKQSGTALSYSMNATSFTSGTAIGTNTDNATSNIGILATDTGTTGATGARLYGMAIIDRAISDSDLVAARTYANDNTPWSN
jgi:hypothetical protein